MHSFIVSVGNRSIDLDSCCDGSYPWYVDYVQEVDDERQKLDAIKALCDECPFCTQDASDPFMLHVDHQAAQEALIRRYREISGMYAKLAAGEAVPYGFEYAAKLSATGDDYGLHVFSHDGADMNDLEFMRYCADSKNPDVLCVKYIWDYHC